MFSCGRARMPRAAEIMFNAAYAIVKNTGDESYICIFRAAHAFAHKAKNLVCF